MTTTVTSFPPSAIASAGPVELLVDFAGELAGQAGNRLELVAAGGEEALGGSEVLEQGALADRADSLQLVEHRAGHRPIAAAAVVLDREAVRLVADPLEELRGLRVGGKVEGGRPPRHVDLLQPLGQPDHGDAALDEGFQSPQTRPELPLAAVDHDQPGQPREALV